MKKVTQIRVSQIKASQIRASQIRETEISSNHRELHGAIFFVFALQLPFHDGWGQRDDAGKDSKKPGPCPRQLKPRTRSGTSQDGVGSAPPLDRAVHTASGPDPGEGIRSRDLRL